MFVTGRTARESSVKLIIQFLDCLKTGLSLKIIIFNLTSLKLSWTQASGAKAEIEMGKLGISRTEVEHYQSPRLDL